MRGFGSSRDAALIWLLLPPLLISSACGRRAGEDDVVRFRATRHLSSIVAFIAEEDGYLERQGLEVETVHFEQGNVLLPLLARGDLDVLETGSTRALMLNLVERDAPLRLVAARAVFDPEAPCPYRAFIARRALVESGRLSDWSSLRGLRIASDRLVSAHYFWEEALRKGGLTFADVELADLSYEGALAALRRGEVDLWSASEPWPTRARQTAEAVVWRPVAEVMPHYQNNFLVFGPRLLEERRDLGQRMVTAYLEAAAGYRREGRSDRLVELMARRTGIPEDDLREMCWPSWSPDGLVDLDQLAVYQEWALRQGLVERRIDPARLVDNSFVEAHLRARGQEP